MSKFSSKTNAFFYRNRNKGIPNLMLFIAIGNVIVYLLYLLNIQDPLFYLLLIFDRAAILRGEVWRLFTYPLTYLMGLRPVLGLFSLFFYVWGGRVLEQYWGTLRFNCFYLLGILLTDAAAMALDCVATASYINLSVFLAMATVMPDEMIRIYFVIPVKMKWLAWVDLGLTLYHVIRGIIAMIFGLTHYGVLYLDWLLPIVALLNYFLFFGKQFVNVLPDFLRFHPKRKTRQQAASYRAAQQYSGPVKNVRPYRFKCTVCGRTDVSDPKLEFRYCSRCAGYRCYCIDHINNHAHITE